MHSRENNHMVDLLFTLTLFGVFAASALLVVIFGARIYQNSVNQMDDNFTTRTALSYIAEKVRRCDSEDCVSLKRIDEITVLSLRQEYDNGASLTTYIYQDGGYLKELSVTDPSAASLAAGQKIMKLSTLTMERFSDRLYCFSIRDNKGREDSLFLSLKSGKEGMDE